MRGDADRPPLWEVDDEDARVEVRRPWIEAEFTPRRQAGPPSQPRRVHVGARAQEPSVERDAREFGDVAASEDIRIEVDRTLDICGKRFAEQQPMVRGHRHVVVRHRESIVAGDVHVVPVDLEAPQSVDDPLAKCGRNGARENHGGYDLITGETLFDGSQRDSERSGVPPRRTPGRSRYVRMSPSVLPPLWSS